MALIFLLDLVTPLGTNVPLLYLVPVLLLHDERQVGVWLAHFVVAVSLTVTVLFVSPLPPNAVAIPHDVLFNRVSSMLVLALFLFRRYKELSARSLLSEMQREREAALVRALEREHVPICAWCKKIRQADDSWLPLESHYHATTGEKFTHAICPSCSDTMLPDTPSATSSA